MLVGTHCLDSFLDDGFNLLLSQFVPVNWFNVCTLHTFCPVCMMAAVVAHQVVLP